MSGKSKPQKQIESKEFDVISIESKDFFKTRKLRKKRVAQTKGRIRLTKKVPILKTISPKFTAEAMIGATNDLRPINFLIIGAKIQEAVAKVVAKIITMSGEQKEWYGTGFMHSVLQDVIKPPGPPGRRIFIFSKLRNPDTDPHELVTGKNMPKIHSDYFLNSEGHRITQPLTNIQYNILKQWKDNNFDIDGDVTPIAETEINPEGLTRAALESCVGGPFVPGIETSFMTRDNYPFIEPFRLDSNHLSPGDLTKQLAIPWQVDFFLCSYEDPNLWWPAQRPDQVITTSGGSLEDWARGIADVEGMVKNWHKLGFVVQKVEEYVETERCE